MNTSSAPDAPRVNIEATHIAELAAQVADLQAKLASVLHGTPFATITPHDDDDHSSSSSGQSSEAARDAALLALGVSAPVARRLAREYPGDYVAAWIVYVQRGVAQGEIAHPAGYLVRCLQGRRWPPERPGPRAPLPRPDRAPGRPVQSTPTPNLPSAQEDAERRQETRSLAEEEACIGSFWQGLDPTARESLLAEAEAQTLEVPGEHEVARRARVMAVRDELIREKLGKART